jgi:hypothetical protein
MSGTRMLHRWHRSYDCEQPRSGTKALASSAVLATAPPCNGVRCCAGSAGEKTVRIRDTETRTTQTETTFNGDDQDGGVGQSVW